MPGYEVKTETLLLGDTPWQIRSLMDTQQYADPHNASGDMGIPPAGWSLFGQVWPSARVLALAMRQARDLAEAVVDTAYEPLVVLDGSLQVLTANRAFLNLFGGQVADTLGRDFYEIGQRQWDFAAMHELLDGVLPGERAGGERGASSVSGAAATSSGTSWRARSQSINSFSGPGSSL